MRDVFLDEFADTDDEVEVDQEAEEREIRKEERRKVGSDLTMLRLNRLLIRTFRRKAKGEPYSTH